MRLDLSHFINGSLAGVLLAISLLSVYAEEALPESKIDVLQEVVPETVGVDVTKGVEPVAAPESVTEVVTDIDAVEGEDPIPEADFLPESITEKEVETEAAVKETEAQRILREEQERLSKEEDALLQAPPSQDPDEPTEEEKAALGPPVDSENVSSSEESEFSAPDGQAGSGVIQGEVFEAASGKGIPDVIVQIEALELTTRSDEKGGYALSGVGIGAHKVIFTKAGYIFEEREIELLNTDKPRALSIGLELRPVESSDETYVMEEFEVIEDYTDEEDTFELVLGAADSPSFTSGIGAADFSKAGVSDVAGALSKVSGANIVDGKYVVVRGLADRYVTTTMNGLPIISADSSRKAVQLDLLPTFMVDQINVDKTYSADKQGDFGGGAVDVITKFIPDERKIKLSFSYDFQEEGADVYLRHSANEQSFLQSGEYQSVDTAIFLDPAANFYDNVRGQSNVPSVSDRKNDQSIKIEYQDVFDLTNYNPSGDELKLGYTLGYQNKYEEKFTQRTFQQFFEDVEFPNRKTATDVYETSSTNAKYAGVSLSGGLLPDLNFGQYRLEDNFTLSYSNFDTQNVSDNIYDRTILSNVAVGDVSQNNFNTATPILVDLERFFPGETGQAFANLSGGSQKIETVVRDVNITQLLSDANFTLYDGDEKRHEFGVSWGNSQTDAIEDYPFGTTNFYSVYDFDTGLDPDEAVLGAFVNGVSGQYDLFVEEGLIPDVPISSFDSPDALYDTLQAGLDGFEDVVFELLDKQFGNFFPEATIRALAAQEAQGQRDLVDGSLETAEEQGEAIRPDLPTVFSDLLLDSEGEDRGLRTVDIIENSKIEHTLESDRLDGYYTYYHNEDVKLRSSIGTSIVEQSREATGNLLFVFPDAKRDTESSLSDAQLMETVFSPENFEAFGFLDPNNFPDGITVDDLNNRLFSSETFDIRNYRGASELTAQYWNFDLSAYDYRIGFGLRREQEKRSYQVIENFPLGSDTDRVYGSFSALENDDLSLFLPEQQDVPVFDLEGNPVLESSGNQRVARVRAREFDFTYYLPSVFLTKSYYEDKLNTGYYWSRTVARPTFFEFIPASTTNADGFVSQGQVTEDTTIDNFDFSTSYNLDSGTKLGMALFYKNLQKPIYGLTDPTGNVLYRNGTSADLYGVEFDGKIELPGPFTLSGNYTYIDGKFRYETPLAPGVELNSSLVEQPNHIVNIILGYEHEGWNANLVYNYTGEYVAVLSETVGGPSINREAFNQLDFNLSKKFEMDDYSLTFQIAVRNLLKESERFTVSSEAFQFADGQDYTTSDRGGRFYSLGASIEF